ncbi:pterin-4-alpha-carbinolamine dehydratase [Sulfuricaulis limicola]|uniref:Putative pterin-4-alpha-carbinolamine dehydratase n=1 Tax=Sulfuricaulis limicola TaxID=1620215 RepID=A0A1B4XGR4_9GAMM|nr:4a-hydroxytetrahydrobiopterin dehydratase [Sulfuricaulis limicola]BAV33959.1 pterin-4-alpha-carbinolamine dehydratase [Sulfuricaulis limicola]
MSDLTRKSCKPCAPGTPPLSRDQARALLEQTPGWSLNDTATELSRSFKFKNYHETMAFVNAQAWIAHREDHHPDIEVGYNRCHVRFSTHSIGGLSENDYICAAKINALLGE